MLIGLREKLLRAQTKFQPYMVDGVPRRVRETFKRYDEIRGYGGYLKRCQKACKRPIPQTNSSLIANHYDLIDVFSNDEAETLRKEAFSLSDDFDYRRGKENKATLKVPDGAFFDKVLEQVFSDETDARLLEYFGSEYVPFWCGMEQTEVSTANKRAFLWHCDKGPSKWAKVLLYFTSVADTGGNSVLIDAKTTDAISALDYTFGPAKERTSDLAELAKQHDIDFEPMSFDVKAGQALLFEPARLLHHGQLPNKAPRTIMQILILPSPRPWREALARLRNADLASRNDFSFPSHARDLEAVLR